VKVPAVVAAASHSAFVVVPETSGVAPAQVPALSKHAVSVPAHVAELHVGGGGGGQTPPSVDTSQLPPVAPTVQVQTLSTRIVHGGPVKYTHEGQVVADHFAPSDIAIPHFSVSRSAPVGMAVMGGVVICIAWSQSERLS
jgi:hypothetical protein